MAAKIVPRFCFALLLLAALLAACDISINTDPPDFSHELSGPPLPWTHEDFDNVDEKFTFAVFSDLYGGERERIFNIAMAQLNLLRPELILSVRDLIDGGTEDRGQLTREWNAFDEKVGRTLAPAFYVGGNHDLTNVTMRDVWTERYSARYYHFVYKNVLFLVLDSEDFAAQRMQEIYVARAAALEIQAGTVPSRPSADSEYMKMPERQTGTIREEQAAYFRKAIADNPRVRWTFLFMHKPVWRNEDATEFQSIEAAVARTRPTIWHSIT